MKMKKSIVFFDLETTGLSVTSDKIIEISMIKENPDGTTEELYSKFNPYPVLVSKEAEAVHGMSAEDLINEPSFADKASDIIAFFEGCDIGGYNIIHFDLPLLFEELARSGKIYDFKKHTIYDSYKIWTKSETRTLSGAVKRYLGESHEHAHQAKADVEVTARILKKQIEEYAAQYGSAEEMAIQTAELSNKIDLSGKFGKNAEGQVIITFGKHKDKTIQQIYSDDNGYLKWMFEKAEFPTDTKLIAKAIYEKLSTVNS